jgi:hypothetical protein
MKPEFPVRFGGGRQKRGLTATALTAHPMCVVSPCVQSPTQWEESLGQRVRGDRLTGDRKITREKAAGPSQKSREAGINQATAWRDPTGRVKATLLQAKSRAENK